MSALERIPPEHLPLTAQDCAALWCVSPQHFLERIACRPGFPERIQRKPAVWLAGEVLAYRANNRAQKRRRA